MDQSPASEADATSIRLDALEERVRLLEATATGTPAVTDRQAAREVRTSTATRLAALGHPSRLELLDGIARGVTTTGDLAALLGTGSTGQLYHHLNQLVAAGWLRTNGRGRYEIPDGRRTVLRTVLTLTAGVPAG